MQTLKKTGGTLRAMLLTAALAVSGLAFGYIPAQAEDTITTPLVATTTDVVDLAKSATSASTDIVLAKSVLPQPGDSIKAASTEGFISKMAAAKPNCAPSVAAFTYPYGDGQKVASAGDGDTTVVDSKTLLVAKVGDGSTATSTRTLTGAQTSG